ncbi:MAG: DNA-directed RNA polymerase subunit delta [Bacillota bacterium]
MPEGSQPQNLRPDLSAADLAYQILKDRREPIGYKELVDQVIAVKGLPSGQDIAKVKAKIHTEISVDGRFKALPGGLWGLREWVVKPPPLKVIENRVEEKPKLAERLREELKAQSPEEDDIYDDSDVEEELVLDEDEEDVLDIDEPEEPEY